MTNVVGMNAIVTIDEGGVTITPTHGVHGGTTRTIAWADVGGVTIAPAAFGARPKLMIAEKGGTPPSMVIVPVGKDEEFAALKAEMVRRVVGAGAPLLQPGDSVLVANGVDEGRRDSASLRAVHGTHLLVTLEDGTDRWVAREDVTRA
jgi:hypothetical protein